MKRRLILLFILSQVAAVLVLYGALSGHRPIFWGGLLLEALSLVGVVIVLWVWQRRSTMAQVETLSAMSVEGAELYSDGLVRILKDRIIIANYYFPSFSGKAVRFADIDRAWSEPPTWKNGKRRIFGSGDLQTWFPVDAKRAQRDKIFFLALKTQNVRVGFTVEDSGRVEEILKKVGVWS